MPIKNHKESVCWWVRHDNVTFLMNMFFKSFYAVVIEHYIDKHWEEAYGEDLNTATMPSTGEKQ